MVEALTIDNVDGTHQRLVLPSPLTFQIEGHHDVAQINYKTFS